MATELMFYTNPMSRGRIVRWMLEEIGAEYQTEVVEYGPAMKSAEYLAINPMGKVPAIVHGGKTITECAAICAYLADTYFEVGLAPPVAERAAYYRWLFYFAGPVESAVINRSLGLEVPPDKEMMMGYGNFTAVMDVVEQLLTSQRYIAGDSFTAADVYCGSQIGWGLQFKSMEARPAFAAYWARLNTRAAYLRANALDDALLPKPAH